MHWHRWGKWEDDELTKFRVENPTITWTITIQVKRCEKCNKMVMRRIDDL